MTKHCFCLNGPLKGQTVAVSEELEFFKIAPPVRSEITPFRGYPLSPATAVEYRVGKWATLQGQSVWVAYCGARPTNDEVTLALRARK